jgi:DNA-directed RNA polymerase subunit F
MILNRAPLALAYVKEYTKELDETKPVISYLKAFCKLSKADADKLSAELRALNNLKMKEETLVKILDVLPRDSEDLGKIFLDVSLTEEEANAILAAVKNY